MNEEHGYIDVTQCGRKFEIGERLHIVPNHIFVAVNLHERVYGIRRYARRNLGSGREKQTAMASFPHGLLR